MLRTTWRVVDQEEIPVVKNSSNIGFTVNPPRWLIYFKHVRGGGGEDANRDGARRDFP